MPNMRDNQTWLDELQSEDPTALQDLHAYLIRGLGYALAKYDVTEVDVEDFTQDAILKIMEALDSFRGESRFTTWASKIATRVALSELRRRRWKDISIQDVVNDKDLTDFTPMILSSKAPSPERLSQQRELTVVLGQAFEQALTDRQRVAMNAAILGGMPIDELAERMGSNRNALYKLIHDGRRRLKSYLLNRGLTYDDFLSAFESA